MQNSTRNKLITLFSAALIVAVTVVLSIRDKQLSTTVIEQNRAFPHFSAEDLLEEGQTINLADITKNQYQLVNVWASWCGICRVEHEYLNQLKNQGVPIVGVNYRDNKLDAINLLIKDGNPFNKIIYDHNGDLSLELGVIGTPETYLIDRSGKVILKISGVLNSEVWNESLKMYFPGS